MRPVLALTAALALGALGAPAAMAGHLPVDETPDYNVVDGRPACGVEGGSHPTGVLEGGLPRVATFNILHAQSEDEDADVSTRQPLIVEAMLDETGVAARADVWGLQEVTNDAEHGNQAQEIAAALAGATGEPWEWCWSLSNPRVPAEPDVLSGGGGPLSVLMAQFSKLPEGDLSGFKEGLAIVSRFDIQIARFRRLQPRAHEALACPLDPNPLAFIDCQFPAAFDSRQVLHTWIDAGAVQFDVFNTHIAHGLTDHSGDTKRRQIEKVVDTVEEWADPLNGAQFLTGDFNTDATGPDAGRLQPVFDAGFVDSYADSGATECRSNALDVTEGCTSSVEPLTAGPTQSAADLDERIDYVFARAEQPNCAGFSVTGSTIIGTNAVQQPDGRWLWPSDHLGVASAFTCT